MFTLLLSMILTLHDPHATVSAYAVRLSTGEVLLDENSEASLYPASCMKIVTTATALEVLGPGARFQTALAIDGPVDGAGTLHGNVILCGGGDPCLGSERLALSWDAQVSIWADALSERGIQRIEGRVIGDASKWEKALAVPSWLWEDLGNYYGAGACALTFHENSYALFFHPASPGEPAPIARTEPPLALHFFNEVTTGPVGSGDRACIYGSEFSSVQHVRGTVPAGVGEFSIRGSVPNPPQFCADALAQRLRVAGQERPRGPQTILHTTLSPPLAQIVHVTNQKSHNLYAEHLLKHLGGGSTEAGIAAVSRFWKSQNIDLGGFNMADGSGLSRKNLITTKQLVALLCKMRQSPHFSLFLNSLPELKKGIRAKTGSMSLARACAGYADDIVFAIIVNQSLDPKIGQQIDSFLNQIASPDTCSCR